MKIPRLNRSGMTLIELVVCGFLMSGIFLVLGSMFVSSISMMGGNRTVASERVDAFMATEHIFRKISTGNSAVITQNGNQLNIRVDQSAAFAPRNTPQSVADDTWISYGIVGGRLRWRADAVNPLSPGVPPFTVGAADPEVQPGLTVSANAFSIINPPVNYTPVAGETPRLVRVDLTAGGVYSGNQRMVTEIALGAQTKR
jgi:type II secretory pathway pseudopilin PulG